MKIYKISQSSFSYKLMFDTGVGSKEMGKFNATPSTALQEGKFLARRRGLDPDRVHVVKDEEESINQSLRQQYEVIKNKYPNIRSFDEWVKDKKEQGRKPANKKKEKQLELF